MIHSLLRGGNPLRDDTARSFYALQATSFCFVLAGPVVSCALPVTAGFSADDSSLINGSLVNSFGESADAMLKSSALLRGNGELFSAKKRAKSRCQGRSSVVTIASTCSRRLHAPVDM